MTPKVAVNGTLKESLLFHSFIIQTWHLATLSGFTQHVVFFDKLFEDFFVGAA
jgi:hypothetical protein